MVCASEKQREEGLHPAVSADDTKGRCQERYPPDEVPVGVGAPAEAHGAVAVEKLLEEWTAGQPHPAACVHAPVGIEKQLLEDLQHKNPMTQRDDAWTQQHAVEELSEETSSALMDFSFLKLEH